MTEWTFLTNYALVLSRLAKHPRITAVEIASEVGITERATRKIIADLEAAGYIDKKKEGRRIKYRINSEMPLRHQTQQDVAIGDFLEVMGWKPRKRKSKSAGTSAESAREIDS